MNVRKLLFEIHKILGLVTGAVVFVVAITGCFWAFKEEIEGLSDDYQKVVPQQQAMITPSQAKEIAQGVFPQNSIHGTIYKKAGDALEVVFYDKTPEFYQSVFLNPYSGEIIRVENRLEGFFAFILKGHLRLWLPREIGEQVVAASVLLFLLIIVSGVWLWIPKKSNGLKQRLKFDWKATTRWKRKNFDLHTVVGIYVWIFAFTLAFTGSLISYNWLKYVVYKSTGGEKEAKFIIPENVGKPTDSTTVAYDRLIDQLQRESPEAKAYEIHYPASKDESVYVEVSNSEGLFYDTDFRFFDQHTLKELETTGIYGKYEQAKFPDKILRMNYDIHIGAIGGLPGKIIAFLSSLVIASLPVTGALLWFGRKFKRKGSKTYPTIVEA
ncbi:putative iron-regulated membrane protein [Dyadobacter jejuensis]|uniref:Putative iron-regulated membrane protein n=1 Tax=Dyadobacter jejuensis TaxID=1082580 RepID=A0A316AIX2_9BACT|nr:PepSY-associated TM helix domain-containing protein [Dyadobacter jejuensis]PWJ57179.1 putative iron-regulated membrane protein [Dyadobacter jejuensis]